MKENQTVFTRKEPTDDFTKKLEQAVIQVRNHDEWRLEYMTLYMRDRENREIGREEGLKEGLKEGREEERRDLIRKAFEKGKTCQEIASLFDIAEKEVERITKAMSVNM